MAPRGDKESHVGVASAYVGSILTAAVVYGVKVSVTLCEKRGFI